MKKIFLIAAIFGCVIAQAQETTLPYRTVPEYPEAYTATSVVVRMIEGLGFRFYWATDGLREEDLQFKPNEEARTSAETVDHIYELSIIINNAILQVANGRVEGLTFKEKREAILSNLKSASDKLKASKPQDLEGYKIKFGNGVEFPFWNLINGPIEDAVWHCGQLVSFRRSSGNPLNGKVSMLRGSVAQ